MMSESVSVAMATFNGQRYLEEQLASLARQAVRPFELVVCDDRSSDSSFTILQKFARTAPFCVRVFQNDETLGYRSNFIKAVSLCRGSLISFCDQDDIWHEQKIGRLAGYFSTSHNLAASHDFSVFYADGRAAIGSYFDFLNRSGFSPAHCVKGCTTTFRRTLIEDFGWPDSASKISPDTWVCLVAALLRKRGFIAQTLIAYRVHEGNASGLIFGGDKPVAKFLRRLPLSPFTSQDELDLTLGYFLSDLIPDREHLIVCSILACAGADLSERDREYALTGLERTMAIRRLITGETYPRTVRRACKALQLFLRLAYRNGDGVQGLLLDLLGRRR